MKYLNLAQDLMNQHPNQTIVVFINPYYYMLDNSIVEVGHFSDSKELAKAIAAVKKELSITDDFDLNWFDVAPEIH
jgi:hypothetical protein